MENYKGLLSFNLTSDDDDDDEKQQAEDDMSIQLPKLQFCFLTEHPTMDEIKAEYLRVKKNLDTMSDKDICNECPEPLLEIIKERFKMFGKPINSENALANEVRRMLYGQTPDMIAKQFQIGESLENEVDRNLEEFVNNTGSIKNILSTVIHPYSQEELDKHNFYDALILDFFGEINPVDIEDFYGRDVLGKKATTIQGRQQLDIALYDFNEGNVWFKLYFNKMLLKEKELNQFLTDYCDNLNWLEKWGGNIDEDGIVEFSKDQEYLIKELKSDPITDLSNYVNIRYYISEDELKELSDSIDKGVEALKKFIPDNPDDSKSFEQSEKENIEFFKEMFKDSLGGDKPIIQVGDKSKFDKYTNYPSDSELYFRDPDAFSCAGFIPTDNIIEKFKNQFGESPKTEDIARADVLFKGVRIDLGRYSRFEIIPELCIKKKFVFGYFISRVHTATGCYCVFYINSKGKFEAIIPPFGNTIDPRDGEPYDIRYNRNYFTETGALKEFDIRMILAQLEMVMYPISKIRTNIRKLGDFVQTIDTAPDMQNMQLLIGRLRFNGSDEAEKFKSMHKIDSNYINIYFKSKNHIRHKSTLIYLSEYFFSLGKKFTESKLIENIRLKENNGNWYLDLRLPDTIGFLDSMFSD